MYEGRVAMPASNENFARTATVACGLTSPPRSWALRFAAAWALPLAGVVRRSTILVMSVCLCACTPATVKVYPSAGVPVSNDGAVIVQAGDSLYGIASRNGVNVVDLARANGIAEPFTIHPGDRLRLPANATAKPSVASAPAMASTPSVFVDALPESPSTAKPTAAKPAPNKGVPATTSSKSTVSKAAPPKAPVSKATTASVVTKPTVAGNTTWQWPANGTLMNAPASGIAYALDIAGTAGSTVRATAAGRVLYSGEGSPGYEQLIVIEHPGGWVSSYSHNRKRLVGEGQSVAAGAAIAEMGHVGASRDMLHFELRHAGQLVDPRTVLPPR